MDGGSRLKGVNSSKSSGALWGPNRRSNRATYPYSEPHSNLCSYHRSWDATHSGVAKLYGPECGLSSGPACALLDRLAWECPPSWGCVTDSREKESPLIILRSEGRGPISYPSLRL
ncbi:hypothetical protein CRG98_005351 [Punica granatum]|uniref:Uncharacterized protein n=1 Tax=Punica granatum TaxID=22663 RepID=A0A2I0L0X2_PUNGR|nr:hypothetical protein CRG98_005351 [Punica granatum]